MKEERSKIKSDILLRVRLLYVLFILAGAVVLGRLVWVQLFSSEVAYNAERLASRIFTEETIPAQRGSILSRGGAPLATCAAGKSTATVKLNGSLPVYVPAERASSASSCDAPVSAAA